MVTTVQISDETKRLLDLLKKDSKKTFDLLIKEMVQEQLQIPKSMAGIYKNKLTPWNKERDRPKDRDEKFDTLRY